MSMCHLPGEGMEQQWELKLWTTGNPVSGNTCGCKFAMCYQHKHSRCCPGLFNLKTSIDLRICRMRWIIIMAPTPCNPQNLNLLLTSVCPITLLRVLQSQCLSGLPQFWQNTGDQQHIRKAVMIFSVSFNQNYSGTNENKDRLLRFSVNANLNCLFIYESLPKTRKCLLILLWCFYYIFLKTPVPINRMENKKEISLMFNRSHFGWNVPLNPLQLQNDNLKTTNVRQPRP